MRLPGPLGWVSLLSSLVLATAPAAMAVFSFTNGSYFAAAVYLLAAALMFAIPEFLIRRLPGPRELLSATLSKLNPLSLLTRGGPDDEQQHRE